MRMLRHHPAVTRADRARFGQELAHMDMAIGVGERACCCPARPVVRVVMPPAPDRPATVDLLLCGHHYRVSLAALLAADAAVYDVKGELIAGTPADERAPRPHLPAAAAQPARQPAGK
jgi:hypothetical protein